MRGGEDEERGGAEGEFQFEHDVSFVVVATGVASHSQMSSPRKRGSICDDIKAWVPAFAGTTPRLVPAAIHRLRLREEAQQDVIDDRVVLLLDRGMRDAGHHGELLVRIRQL